MAGEQEGKRKHVADMQTELAEVRGKLQEAEAANEAGAKDKSADAMLLTTLNALRDRRRQLSAKLSQSHEEVTVQRHPSCMAVVTAVVLAHALPLSQSNNDCDCETLLMVAACSCQVASHQSIRHQFGFASTSHHQQIPICRPRHASMRFCRHLFDRLLTVERHVRDGAGAEGEGADIAGAQGGAPGCSAPGGGGGLHPVSGRRRLGCADYLWPIF